jgi:uncharacterized protein with PhoU and TrkA domain
MARLDKIEYKPISVRDLLVEMKDLSELMIDLAYSAALFNSRPLAEEVIEMERRVDNLAYLLDMSAMIAVRNAKDAEALVAVAVVAAAADKISDAAGDIASIVLREIGIHPIVREAFERVEEHLTRTEIQKGSVWANKTLHELELAPKMGVDIIAIRRDKDIIINPERDELVLEGDVVIARGAPMGIEEFERLAGRTVQPAGS